MELDLNFSLLSVLVTLYERRSVSAAARQLGKTQSAVSMALLKLRHILGDELFIRTGSGMVPTPRARLLTVAARDALQTMKLAIAGAETFDPVTTTTTFVLALSEGAELHVLPRVFKQLERLAPGARCRSLNATTNDLLEGLESGEIDLAIGVFPELEMHRFCRQRLLVSRFACVMRVDHPIRGKSVSREEYLKASHLRVRNPRTRHAWDVIFRGAHLAMDAALEVAFLSSVPRLLQDSDLLATLPYPIAVSLIETNRNLRMADPPFASAHAPALQYWHSKFERDARNRWIRRLTKAVTATE